MPTLTDRIKAFLDPTSQAQKSYGNSLFNLFGYAGRTYPDGNLTNDKFGFAEAYLSVLAVRQAVDYYAISSMAIPSEITKNTTGNEDDTEIIARSDDVKPHDIWYFPARHHRKEHKISPIPAMVYNMVLYDAVFVEKIKNMIRVGSNFRVLNALGMQIDDSTGDITGYRYSWNNEYMDFKPQEIAYEHGFNPFYDNYGASILESALSKIDIENSLDRFLRAFFKNNATLGLIGSPKSQDPLGGSLTSEQTTLLRKIINDWHQGVSNAFRPLILNTPVDLQAMPIPEVDKYTNIGMDIDKKILGAFGINPILVGDGDSTSYKEDLPQIEAQFVNKRMKPILSQIETLINIELLPFLTRSNDYRFAFDYSDYQLVTEQDTIALEINTTKYQSGGLSVNEYREANGQTPIKELEDYYIFEGVPVPLAEIPNLWQYKFGMSQQSALPESTDNVQDADDKTDDTPQGEPEDDTTKSHTHDHAHDLTYEDYNKAFYSDAPSLDDIFTELKTWLKYVKADKHVKSAFDPVYTRGSIADAILAHTDKSAILEAVNTQLDLTREYQKAIQSTRLEYEFQVEDLLIESREKRIDKSQFKLKMMQAIRAYCKLAFIDGLRDGGVFSEPNEDESAQIESHVIAQRQYVNNLADTIYGDGISDALAQQKPAMWYNKSVSPMYDAGKASADKNGIYEWVYGITEHCKDCQKLNGQRHRMKTYYARGILPQSDRLACKGFNCRCNLIRVVGTARGKLPSI